MYITSSLQTLHTHTLPATHTHIHVHSPLPPHAHMHPHTRMRIPHSQTHTCKRVHHTLKHTHTNMPHTRKHTHTHSHTHTHALTHTHAHTHTDHSRPWGHCCTSGTVCSEGAPQGPCGWTEVQILQGCQGKVGGCCLSARCLVLLDKVRMGGSFSVCSSGSPLSYPPLSPLYVPSLSCLHIHTLLPRTLLPLILSHHTLLPSAQVLWSFIDGMKMHQKQTQRV